MSKLTDYIYELLGKEIGYPDATNSEKLKEINNFIIKKYENIKSPNIVWKETIDLAQKLDKNNLTLDQYAEIIKNNHTVTQKNKRIKMSTEELLEIDCWTNDFYESAYKVVKDRKYPIIIPSYNRPDCLFLK